MQKLAEIISNLESHQDIDAVFLTGSYGQEHKSYSDIDLVIILKKNTHNLTSLYTWIDNKFADVFFFDHRDLERIETSNELSGNAMDAVFVSWLQKAVIQFDKSGKLNDLKSRQDELLKKIAIPQPEKDTYWQKINYNFVANTRYFQSDDPIYHEALEVRLLYSVSEVFSGYFTFRDVLWRGEKMALHYLKENDVDFYEAFLAYAKASSIEEKFNCYTSLVKLVFSQGYTLWNTGDIVPQVKDQAIADKDGSIEFWKEIAR